MTVINRTNSTKLARVFRGALLTSAACISGGAVEAQQVAQAPAVEEIVITGSRIRIPGLESNSPITTISANEMNFGQPVAAEEIIKMLPAVVPALGPGTNNGANGGSTIDLRNLGEERTLVLIDGRRITPFNLDGLVDTNVVPVQMLERADLVTGGASAVYGADAVAGVVNFVMKRNFEGVTASASYGISSEGDASRWRGDIIMGGNFADDRGNVVVSVGYTDTEKLLQGDRPLGRFSLSSTNGAVQGSGTDVPAQLSVAPTTGNPALSGQINPATGLVGPAGSGFNFQPVNLYQAPIERYQFTSMGRYELTDWAEFYMQALYSRTNLDTQLAESGSFLNVFQVPIGNPYIPDGMRNQICTTRGIPGAQCVAGPAGTMEVPITIGRRFTELGPRLNDFKNKWFQYSLGFRGDITDSWSYDIYWQRGEADQTQVRGNWGSLSKVQQALRAVTTTACTNTANGCVPINLFGAQGSITQPMLNFINLNALVGQRVNQKVIAGSVSGDLGDAIKSPWSELPIGVAVGLERRTLNASNQSDGSSQIQGEVLGTGAPTPDRSGTFTLSEAYGETLIPVVSGAPFMHALNIELGYRRTKFETTGSSSYGSAKFGGEWAPIEELRIRAMGQRATRSPNVNELFAPAVSGLTNLAVDPCQLANINQAQANTAGTLSNLCRQTGVPLASIGQLPAPSAGQINQLQGGNPNLGPEKAKTMTIGFVWQPSFVRNLAITLDYYEINLNAAIERPAATDVLDQCYSTAFNPQLALVPGCALIRREPTNGTFNGATAPGVVRQLSNLGQIDTSGFDLSVTYRVTFEDMGMSPNLGALNFGFTGNKMESFFQQPTPAAVRRDCKGYYSVACEEPVHASKWTQRLNWDLGDFDLGYNWRHVSAVIEEPGGTNFHPPFASIPAYDYFDLSAGWDVTDYARVALAINNAFNKAPPNVGQTIGTTGTNSGNTFPQNYDTVGRFFSLSTVVRF